MSKQKDKLYEKETTILCMLKEYSEKGKLFFYSNKRLAETLGVTKQTISNMISKLKRLEYIKVELDDGKRILKYTHKEFKASPIYPRKKYIDMKLENDELPKLHKKIKELQVQLEYVKDENSVLRKKCAELEKKCLTNAK